MKYDMVDKMQVLIRSRDPNVRDISKLFKFKDVHIPSGLDTVSWETMRN